MTFYSLTQTTRLLSIDAKTLHRWLTEAHLCLQCHPADGRKKVLSAEQLSLLASRHHREVLTLSQQSPPSLLGERTALPAALLTLPEQVVALQTQIATLQQQVVDLTHVLTQPTAVPHSSTGTPSPTPKPKKPTRARPATQKTPPKPTHVIARVEYGEAGHYVVICPKRGVLPFEPDTPQWFAWVERQESFRFVGENGSFTAHHEWRIPKGAWRAHRHLRNRVTSQRLAPNHELTIAVLEQAAEALQAQLS